MSLPDQKLARRQGRKLGLPRVLRADLPKADLPRERKRLDPKRLDLPLVRLRLLGLQRATLRQRMPHLVMPDKRLLADRRHRPMNKASTRSDRLREALAPFL